VVLSDLLGSLPLTSEITNGGRVGMTGSAEQELRLGFDDEDSQPEIATQHGALRIATKKWRDRSNTFAYLPGKGSLQVEALRRVVGQLPKKSSDTLELQAGDGTVKKYPPDEVCGRQLGSSSIAYRDKNGEWRAADEILDWFRTGDDLLLAQYIHANVKLFGELLPHIKADLQTSDLLAVAASYGLNWTSPDQIHRRLAWMQSLKLIERWGFNRLVLTDRGREFLRTVELCEPDVALGQGWVGSDEPTELPAADAETTKEIAGLDQKRLKERKVLIGYIPRGRKALGRAPSEGQASALDATRTFVELVGEGASSNEIFARAAEHLAMKKSSFTQSMHTFRHMNMVDLISFNRFAATPVALRLLEPGNEVEFARYIHSRYRYFGEILPLLHSSTPVSEIVRVAVEEYGLTQIENSEVRTRLGFLADAGMVERIDWTRYRITPLGRLLSAELPMESLPARDVETPAASQSEESSVVDSIDSMSELFGELRRYSRSRDHSIEFEQSIARAFELLGFRAEHHGGSGKTDVLVTAELPPENRYSSIIDAKASASGTIGDNAVKFDALKDHKKRHKADFGMIVGPDFEGRVKEWAANNGIVLVTVEELINLLERHQRTPLTLLDLRGLFEHPGMDLAEIDELYDAARHNIDVIEKIVALLYQEANDEDPVNEGYMMLENLYYTIRKEVIPRPSKKTIDDALMFLGSTLVKAVAVNGNRYKLVDAPSNVRRRLGGLGIGLDAVVVDDSAS